MVEAGVVEDKETRFISYGVWSQGDAHPMARIGEKGCFHGVCL